MGRKNTMKGDLHGLAMFISDIRNSKCKETEIKRVNKELAKIRAEFGSGKIQNGYNKKKYLCKLVFIFLLGYDFDCGHIEAINLLTSNIYSEKSIGYMFVSVVMSEKSNLMMLVIKAIESDLSQFSDPVQQNLALKYVANMANKEMVDVLSAPVMRLLFSGDTHDTVKQSAILCLLRLFRLKPDIIPEKDYPDRIVNLLTYPHLGVVTAAVSLIEELAIAEKLDAKSCITLTISKLKKVVKSECKDLHEYSYYYIPAPWLTVKLLRLLRHFSFPTDHVLKSCLVETIEIIFNKIQEPPKTKRHEHRNSKNSVIFEAIHLVHYMEMDPYIQINACNILEMCLKQQEPNMRYLVLEAMSLLANTEVCRIRMKEQLITVMDFLQKEKDVCIRRKITDLLYTLCDQSNVKLVLDEMVYYMETEDVSFREEIVLKISILAERCFQDRTLYIDVILNLLLVAGEYVPDAVWHRFIQIVTNEEELQSYAAQACFETLQNPHCHERLVSLVGYILGEFGNLIAGDVITSPLAQLRLLHSNFHLSSNEAKAILLTTYMKFANLYDNLKKDIKAIFEHYIHSCDAEIQQRAIEYLTLCKVANREVLIKVMDKMPISRKETFVEDNLYIMKSGTSEVNPQKADKMSRSVSLCRSSSIYKKSVQDSATDKGESSARSMTLPKKTGLLLSDCQSLSEVDGFSYRPKDPNCSRSIATICLTSSQEALKTLIWQQGGILYESTILLVNIETSFQKYRGHIYLKYTNKTSEIFCNFRPSFPTDHFDKLKLEVKPCPDTLQPYDTIKQEVEVECIQNFDHRPFLSLSFVLVTIPENLPLFLPLNMNKFIEPVNMTRDEFFRRWGILDRYQENLKTFPAKCIMEGGLVANKLKGTGLMLLQDIDPVKENFVGSGIFHSKFLQVGILLRLQSDISARMYRLTIRSTTPSVSEEVCKLLRFIL